MCTPTLHLLADNSHPGTTHHLSTHKHTLIHGCAHMRACAQQSQHWVHTSPPAAADLMSSRVTGGTTSLPLGWAPPHPGCPTILSQCHPPVQFPPVIGQDGAPWPTQEGKVLVHTGTASG